MKDQFASLKIKQSRLFILNFKLDLNLKRNLVFILNQVIPFCSNFVHFPIPILWNSIVTIFGVRIVESP